MNTDYCPENTACFTGHRDLSPLLIPEIHKNISNALCQAYEAGYRNFLCGGARGFDTHAAMEVLLFRKSHPEIRLIIAVPCLSQADRWPSADRY